MSIYSILTIGIASLTLLATLIFSILTYSASKNAEQVYNSNLELTIKSNNNTERLLEEIIDINKDMKTITRKIPEENNKILEDKLDLK